MNKRGQLPTILMFIVALVLALSALYTFVTFSSNFNTDSANFAAIMSDAEFNQDYSTNLARYFAESAIKKYPSQMENITLEFKRVANERKTGVVWFVGVGNLFIKIEGGDFKLERTTTGYSLKIDGLFTTAERRANKIKRNYNISLEFDENGAVV